MNPILETLLGGVVLPEMAPIEQHFPDAYIVDAASAVRLAMLQSPAVEKIRPGMRIALSVGSRGIDRLPELVRGMVDCLKERGAKPFIVPAMGSHGGATASGQTSLLAELGINAEAMACPILSSMDTVEIGSLADGTPVRMDAFAQGADGIVVFNRIKPHNAFRAPHESGLVKMLAIGLGKQSGADACHRLGFGHMGRLIAEMARMKLARCPVIMGVGVLENAYDRLRHIVVTGSDDFIEQDAAALKLTADWMPHLPCQKLDLLIVDRLGKEFSGGGMDANITGRFPTKFISGGPDITTIVVLDMTAKSRGNANGVGLADVCTAALAAKVDQQAMYANALTSRVTDSVRMPMIMPDEYSAIRAAIKVCCAPVPTGLRCLRIANTLHLGKLYASAALLPELQQNTHVQVLEAARPMTFDSAKLLAEPWW